MNRISNSLLFIFILCSCTSNVGDKHAANVQQTDSLALQDTLPKAETEEIKPGDIQITKELLYNKYTLDDTYPYKDTTRSFQWEKIKKSLALLENIPSKPAHWGILQNYKNRNGEAPLVKKYKRNVYQRIADTLGVERYQSVPLYLLTDTIVPELYGQDGSLIRLIEEKGNFIETEPVFIGGKWLVPSKYVQPIEDSIVFKKAIIVDRTNQNIMSLEHTGKAHWVVRSMNPATTGRHHPPYAQETPLGMFVVQDKKAKMVFLKDGSKETGGYAPYASRFTDGAYIHGVPVNAPRTSLIEYSPSLGTIPRSHMCVRNATSHAKFIFDWAPVNQTIVFVIE